MARYIHCENCKIVFSVRAACYDELYESVEGFAKKDMFCDGCMTEDFSGATPILKGEKCYASILLPNEYHFNYYKQHPDNWAEEFIEIK